MWHPNSTHPAPPTTPHPNGSRIFPPELAPGYSEQNVWTAPAPNGNAFTNYRSITDASENVHMKKQKRCQTAFTKEQIVFLERKYKKKRTVRPLRRRHLARILDVSDRSIKIWFQNRRIMEKKEQMKLCSPFNVDELYRHDQIEFSHSSNSNVIGDQHIPLPVTPEPVLHTASSHDHVIIPQTIAVLQGNVMNYFKNNFTLYPDPIAQPMAREPSLENFMAALQLEPSLPGTPTSSQCTSSPSCSSNMTQGLVPKPQHEQGQQSTGPTGEGPSSEYSCLPELCPLED